MTQPEIKKVQCKQSPYFQTLDMCVNTELALFEKHQDGCVISM